LFSIWVSSSLHLHGVVFAEFSPEPAGSHATIEPSTNAHSLSTDNKINLIIGVLTITIGVLGTILAWACGDYRAILAAERRALEVYISDSLAFPFENRFCNLVNSSSSYQD
jgi:hypothetical protein